MKTPEETLCFTCGLPLGDPPRLNHLPGGQVCPTCVDRLLETLPPLLPSRDRESAADLEPEAEEAPASARQPRRLGPREPDLPKGA